VCVPIAPFKAVEYSCSTALTGAIGTHTKGQDMQPNTDSKHREKANTETKPVTSVKSNLWLSDDGPYEVRNMLECILEF
jgi:hypothetical protein